MPFKFNLGDRVKDLVTGFKGVIMYRVEYLTGCNQYGVNAGEPKEGMPIAPEHQEKQFDENRLVLNGKPLIIPGLNDKPKTGKEPGGPVQLIHRSPKINK